MKLFCNRTFQLLLLLVLISSCNSYKKLAYLQTPNKSDTVFTKIKLSYRLQPADQIYVKVKSLDQSVNDLFNMDLGATSSNMSSMSSGGGMYLMSYSISPEGTINLPVFGKIKVGGLTLYEATVLLEERANEYIKEARVDLKLVSFKVSLLGEVKSPGQQTIMADEASIFEVLARGGDLTYYGNRKKVFIIRSTEKQNEIITVDLTRRDLLESSRFYLQPNDVIYVEPLKKTAFRINLSDYATILSTLSSSIALIVLIASLSK